MNGQSVEIVSDFRKCVGAIRRKAHRYRNGHDTNRTDVRHIGTGKVLMNERTPTENRAETTCVTETEHRAADGGIGVLCA